jgi:hypothetical protein
MPTIRVEKSIAAAPASVWALLQDFAHIDAFNPNLRRSFRIGDAPSEGLGAERQCDLADGRNWIRERVVDWRPGDGYTVEITEGTLPIRDIRTKLGVLPESRGSRAYMEISYRPKYGLLGRLLDLVMLRRTMRRLMTKVLDGLGDKATRQAPVNLGKAA